jgi:sulfate permease, SulP family
VIALVGFMESIAMAKALAAKTHQRLDPNQELIGQGVANLGGAFFQSYPSCGSFTGSAINLQAGAQTGFAMVFNGLFVVATLLFLTPYLYYLPKATLAVIILFAVTSLLTPAALKHTWRASRADGMVALTTFTVTLLAAPHLDKGILIGAALAVLLYLLRTMKPRVAELGRHPDGALRDVHAHTGLPTSTDVIALRYDDSLYFANAAFFEEAVLEALARKPQAKVLLVVCGGINQIDASGDEVVRHLVERLRAAGLTVVFSGMKKQVLDVMRATGLAELIGAEHIFPGEDQALAAIYRRLGREGRGELELPAPGPAGT